MLDILASLVAPSGFPQAVTVQIRQNGITFEWEIPQASERNGIIVYYLIRYLMASGTTTLYNHSIADTATFSEPNKLSRTFANVEEGTHFKADRECVIINILLCTYVCCFSPLQSIVILKLPRMVSLAIIHLK